MITVFETELKHNLNWELILSIGILIFFTNRMLKKNQARSASKILWIIPIVLSILTFVEIVILVYVEIVRKMNLTGIGVFIVTGLLMIACDGINYIICESIADKESPFTSYIPLLAFSALMFILGCLSFGSFQSNDLAIIEAYESYINGEADIIEGYISEFTLAGEGYSREAESFVVNGKEFNYSDNRSCSSTIYSTRKQSGGVIKGNGQYVKIWYYDVPNNPMILRIDVLKEQFFYNLE